MQDTCPPKKGADAEDDRKYQYLVLFFGFLTRFIWLDYPNEVVFDEVHFGKFLTEYCCRNRQFFDIHPPLGKMLLGAAGYFSNYHGQQPFKEIHEEFIDSSYIYLRALPALSGAVLPWIMYKTSRLLGQGPFPSFIVGMLTVLDHSLLVESRLILTDGLLFLSCQVSFLLYLVTIYWERRHGSGFMWCLLVLATGISFGAMLGIKWVAALATFGSIGVHQAILLCCRLVSNCYSCGITRWRRVLNIAAEAVRAVYKVVCWVVLPLIMHILVWELHFLLLPNAYHGAHGASKEKYYAEDWWLRWWTLSEKMYSISSGMVVQHHWGTTMADWPLMTRGVHYWYKNEPDGSVRRIYLLGNPVVWYTCLVGLGVIVAALCISLLWKLLKRLRSQEQPTPSAEAAKANAGSVQYAMEGTEALFLLSLAYLANYAPFYTVSRQQFLYHYCPALLYSMLLFGHLMQQLVSYPRVQHFIGKVIVMVGSAAYIFWAPLAYGFALDGNAYRRRLWLSTWD